MACSPPGGAASSLSIHPPSSGTSILAKVLGLQVISDIVVDVCRSEVWVSELKGSQAWACYRHYLESYIYIDIFYIYESEDVCVYIYIYTHIHIERCVCVYTYMYIHISVYIYIIYIYICLCICVYVYTQV